MTTVGVVVGSDKVTLVEGDISADGTVTLIKDEIFDLEDGERHRAYGVMHRRVADRFSSGADKVVLKASSAGKFTGTQGALNAAELRGVFLSALPNRVEVVQFHAKTVSRDFGSRKLGDYLKDEDWWAAKFSGACRKGSREAAFLIIASIDG